MQVKAELDNLESFGFVDSPEAPFFFTFKVECANCHEVHANEVAFNAHELKPLANSRGEANFAMKCKFCSKEGNISVQPKLGEYTAGTTAKMASFDCRGLVLVEFVPRGEFWAKSESSKFEFEFDDSEFFDYDEKAGVEVSITDCEWTIVKS